MENNDLLALLACGLEGAAQEHTATTLGDRRAYLGMSDLVGGLRCSRAAVASKLAVQSPKRSLGKLITLRRGHWLEHGVEEALRALKLKYLAQVEISFQHQGVPIKIHPDLILIDAAEKSITVVEVKSVGHLREQVYGSHEAQLYGQLSALAKFWDKPVFTPQFGNYPNNTNNSKAMTFPELVKDQLGVKLPRAANRFTIDGFVLTVSPNAAKAFGPYQPNQEILDMLLGIGVDLWQRISEVQSGQTSLDILPHQTGFSPLCDWCNHNHNCPKFSGIEQPELEPELLNLTNLKEQRSQIDQEIKEREEQLKAISSLMGRGGQWIKAVNHRFKVSTQAGRVTLDQNKLHANLNTLQPQTKDDFLALVESSQTQGRPFERFNLSPVNQ